MSRSSYYYEPAGKDEENLKLMRLMDEQYLLTPFYGYRSMWAYLRNKGYKINEKQVQRFIGL